MSEPTAPTIIEVTGADPYAITVGRGLLASIADHVPPGAAKLLVVHAPPLAAVADHRLPIETAETAKAHRG